MPLSAKPALLVVALAVAASLAGVAAADTPAAFAVLSAVPRPAALRSIHTVRGALQLCLAPAARAAQALGALVPANLPVRQVCPSRDGLHRPQCACAHPRSSHSRTSRTSRQQRPPAVRSAVMQLPSRQGSSSGGSAVLDKPAPLKSPEVPTAHQIGTHVNALGASTRARRCCARRVARPRGGVLFWVTPRA